LTNVKIRQSNKTGVKTSNFELPEDSSDGVHEGGQRGTTNTLVYTVNNKKFKIRV
jgi:hypothetical protein